MPAPADAADATGAPPSLSPAALRRNLALDISLAVSIGLVTTVAGSLIPTIARQAGLVPIGLAVMSAAPFLGNLLGAFAGRFGPQRIRGYALLRAGAPLLLVGVALAPNAALIVGAVAVFQLAISFGAPFQTRLWGAMYPAEVRARVIGILGTARSATAGVAAVAVGALADAAGVPLAVTLAGILGALAALAGFGLRSGTPLPARAFSAREAVRALTSRPALQRLVLAQGFYGAGLIASFPLYALVNVDRLHLSLADVGLLAVIGGIATTASYVAWGGLVDRFGFALGLRAGAALGTASIAAVALAPGYPLLVVGSVCAGLSGAAMDLGIQGAMAHHTPLSDRAAAMAGWNAVTGLRGVVAAIVAGAVVQAGLLDVTAALLLCLVPAGIGLALYCDAPVPAIAGRRRLTRARAGADAERVAA